MTSGEGGENEDTLSEVEDAVGDELEGKSVEELKEEARRTGRREIYDERFEHELLGFVIELGDRLDGAAATMAGEADELAARRPHPDAHLYDIEEGLRFRAQQLNEWLQEEYYR